MNSKLFSYLSLLGLSSIWQPTYGYEEYSHEALSRTAVESALAPFLPRLGLKSVKDELTNSQGQKQSIISWCLQGTKQEDATFSKTLARYRHHFYDPIHKTGYLYFLLTGEASPDWASLPFT